MFGKLKTIDPVSFFSVAALGFILVYGVVRPPMQSPDEFNHFLRAYQISEGKFMPVKSAQRLGGDIPVCLEAFMTLYRPGTYIQGYKTTRKEMLEGFDIAFSDGERLFVDFPNTSYYSFVSYMPQSLALFILRQFNCSVGILYHGSRLFTALVWVLCMCFVIRLLPFYKWLFTLLLLTPMSLYVAVSYSADTVTNILSLLLTAFILRLAFRSKVVTKGDLFLLLLLGVLLAFAKIVYIGLVILLLLVPAANFGSRTKKYLAFGGILLMAFLAAAIWSRVIMHYYTPFKDYNSDYRTWITLHRHADYAAQKDFLKNNPFHFFVVLYNSVVSGAGFFITSYIGFFGTYMDTPLPSWLIYIYIGVICFVSLTENTAIVLTWRMKLVLLLAAFASYALLVLSQYLTWNDVGENSIEPLQGRYLVPLLPLVFMMLHTSWKRIKLSPLLPVLLLVCFANVKTAAILYKRYYRDPAGTVITTFSCGMERTDSKGSLITSNPAIVLTGDNFLESREHRSGGHSLMLPPDSSQAAHYFFNDLRFGDVLEIYAWQKGRNGELVVKGKGKNCEPFYFINKDIQMQDKQGWKKMQMIFSAFVRCDSSEVEFYLHNPTKDTIFFDDLLYRLRKFR